MLASVVSLPATPWATSLGVHDRDTNDTRKEVRWDSTSTTARQARIDEEQPVTLEELGSEFVPAYRRIDAKTM